MAVMLNVEDVVRGLKRLKSLAKQDLLVSSRTANPAFWSIHADARKQKYEDLITMVSEHGVSATYNSAINEYLNLPESGEDEAHIKGKEQALEMFLQTLGVDRRTLAELRSRRPGAQEVQ